MRQMLAGMVLLSAMVGMLAVGLGLALSAPIWMVIAAYPAVCSLTLLATAVLITLRNGQAVRSEVPRPQA